MNIETKLERFSDVVQKEAEMLHQKRLGDAQGRYKDMVADFEQKEKAKYEAMFQDAEIQAERGKQRKITDKNNDIKRTLIKKRTDYIAQVFEDVDKLIADFFKKDDYQKLIIDNIKAYAHGNEDAVAYIMARDAHMKSAIESATGVKVEVTDEDFLGGVRIRLDEKKIADLTYKNKLAAEHTTFNKIKIL